MPHIPGWQRAFAEMVRKLKPNGFLIYSDLIYPNWLAAIGKTLAGNWFGFPKVAVERLVETYQLRGCTVHWQWLSMRLYFRSRLIKIVDTYKGPVPDSYTNLP